ncbi:MAG: PEP-CTERM sorting domain-containing protein [Thermoleophilia bacterium]|nr:PEP-CTERM sorting domain-containing protein [Thermoleophilia bacterium]MDH4344852.1 PEP-CTERM sorting domain-containing protein [Thermoleophilia bacterium]
MTWTDRGHRAAFAAIGIAVVALGMSLTAGAQSTAKNLIVNGNAEQGAASPNGYDVVPEVPGWKRRGGFTVVEYGASDFPGTQTSTAVHGGAKFFAGGPGNASSAVTQTISVASQKQLIDSGKAKGTLSGYLGGYGGQDDSLIATAVFLGQSGARLGTMLKLGPVGSAARKLQTGMIRQTVAGSIPKGTRTIRVTLSANRTSGSYNDGYADNLSLTIGR